MGFVVGIDLVSVKELERSIALFGDRFLARVFTSGELQTCQNRAERLAARFAAKEAVFKALRVAHDQALSWRAVEVDDGEIVLHGDAKKLAKERGIAELALSLTHEADYAAAVVIGEKNG